MPNDGREYLQPHNPLTRAPIVPSQACEPAMRAAELDAETERDRLSQKTCVTAGTLLRDCVSYRYDRDEHPHLHNLIDIARQAIDMAGVHLMSLDHKRSQEQKESQ